MVRTRLSGEVAQELGGSRRNQPSDPAVNTLLTSQDAQGTEDRLRGQPDTLPMSTDDLS